MPDRSYLPLKSFMSRPRINNLLKIGLTFPLTTIVAGIGYGKTVAVAGFLKDYPAKLIWMKIYHVDNDPRRFWQHFLQAVNVELPDLYESLYQLPFPNTPGFFISFMQVLADTLDDGEPLVVVIDEFEDLESSQIKDFIRNILNANFKNLFLVLLSNQKADTNILGITSSADSFQIGPRDLCFTKEESRDYFAYRKVRLSEETLETLHQGTEGWPLAISYICHQFQKDANLSLSDIDITLTSELFENEFFRKYDENMRNLLIKLSLFQSFPIAFLDLMYKGNRNDALDFISNHMFFIYDYREKQFVFHSMYRNFLVHKQAYLPPEQIRDALKAGGEWYLAHDYFNEAVYCFWEIRDYERFLDALFTHNGEYMAPHINSYLLDLLNSIPADYRDSHPRVDFCRAYYYLALTEIRTAKELFTRVVDNLSAQKEENKLLLGSSYAVLGDISLMNNTDEFLEYYQKAQMYLKDSNISIRTDKTLLLGNDDAFFLHQYTPGALEEIRDKINKAAIYMEGFSGGCGYGYDTLFMAESEYNIGHFDKAREYSYQAILRAKKHNQHDIICNAYFVLIELELALGHYQLAFDILDSVLEYTQDREALFEMRDCIRSWFEISLGRPEETSHWIKNGQTAHDRGRSKLIGALHYIAIERYPKALAFLVEAECEFQEKGLQTLYLKILILKSICYQCMSNEEQAMDCFHPALKMTACNQILMPFVVLGGKMCVLVQSALKEERNAEFTEFLHLIYQKALSYEKNISILAKLHQKHCKATHSSGISLTENEKKVLAYMAEGFTRNEIATLQHVSINTLKKQISVIYNKLGALNSADAIRIAVMRGEMMRDKPPR